MKQKAKRLLALVLSVILLITSAISGLVFPTVAAEIGDSVVFEDFEDDTFDSAVTAWKNKGTLAADPLSSGNQVLKITAACNGVWSGGGWRIEPNSVYKLSLKAYNGTGVKVEINGNKGIFNGSLIATDTTAGWTQLTSYIRTKASVTNDGYGFSLTAPAGTYLDDIRLTKVADDGNLLPDGDFEESALHYTSSKLWQTVAKGGELTTDPTNAGNHVYHFTKSSDRYIMDTIGLKPNTTYTLSMKAKGKNFKVYVNAEKGFETGGWHEVLSATGRDTWESFTVDITTKSSVSDYGYCISFGTNNGTADAYIDDIKLIEKVDTAISMDTSLLKLEPGASEQLELIVTPSGAAVTSVVWSSSDESIVTVDTEGKVTAASDKSGTVIITATATVPGLATPLTATRVVRVSGAADLVFEDFEDTTTVGTVSGWKAKGELVADPLNGGNQVLKITSACNSVWSGGGWYIEPNSVYKLTLKAYNGTDVKIDVNGDKGFANGGLIATDTTAGWTQITSYMRTKAAVTNDGYGISLTAPANTYIDDIQFVKIEDDGNLLPDGDFEESALHYTSSKLWQSVAKGGELVADPSNAENHVYHFTKSSDRYIMDTIGLKPNTTYTLSMKARGKNFKVYINRSKGFETGDWHEVLSATGRDTWEPFTMSFTTQSSVSDYGYCISFGTNNGTADAYIDDIMLTVTPATGISMSQEPLTVAQGSTEKLDLTVVPKGGAFQSVIWTSGDESIATVDAEGNVTASTTKTGDVTITATAVSTASSTPLVASRVVTVVGNADSFAFKSETMALVSGLHSTATVIATPLGANVGNLTFTSDNPSVATVDANGLVTAVANGTATITVKNADNAVFAGTVSDTLTVTVSEAGNRIIGGDFDSADSNHPMWTTNIIKSGVGTVEKDEADRTNQVLSLPSMKVGALAGVVLRANKSYRLTFKARGEAVKTYINGVKTGDTGEIGTFLKANTWTTVTRTFTTNATPENARLSFFNNGAIRLEIDDVTLVELPEATDISVVPSGTIVCLPDTTVSLAVSAVPAEAFVGGVTYVSDNPSVATVNDNGKITVIGKHGQQATITVSAVNEQDQPMVKTVTVKVDDYGEILSNGDFEQGNKYWVSAADVNSMLVSGAGKDGSMGLTLPGSQENKIEIWYRGGALPLLPGTTYELSYDCKTTSDSDVRLWTGTVGFDNHFVGNSKGEWAHRSVVFTTPPDMKLNTGWDICIVVESSSTVDSVIDNLSLKMYNSGVAAESIEMSHKTVRVVPGRTAVLSVAATPTNGDINRLIWKSSNENVATVEYGVVTGVGKGTATITATTQNGKSATAVVTVSGNEAMIKNGTFDIAGDASWTMENATVTAGVGVSGSNAAQLTGTESKVSQVVYGLKPNTPYTLKLRYAGKGSVGVLLSNGTTEPVKAEETASAAWTTKTYTFTTGDTVSADARLELTMLGAGPVYFDNILLTEKASLIDLVVNDIFWESDTPLEQDYQVKTGTKLKFFVTVLNQGEDPIVAGTSFDVDVKVDAKTVQTLHFTAKDEISTGEMVLVEGTEYWTAVDGDHTVSALANSTLTILESNDGNNDYLQVNLHVDDTLIEVPALAEQMGYGELVFNDEFESLNTIDNFATGDAGYKWYITRPYGVPTLTRDDYEIKNGILYVKNKIPTYNYGMATVDAVTGRGQSYNKGYLEFRFRIPEFDKSKEGIPAVWSFPPDKITETGEKGFAKQWVEVDFMEYWGKSDKYPNGDWTITMHENIRDYAADGVTVLGETYLSQISTEDRHRNALGDMEWHTASFLWTDNLFVGYLDGVETYRVTYGKGVFSDPMYVNGATEDGSGALSYLNDQYLSFILGGSVDNNLEIDYIRFWSGNGNGYMPDDGDGEADNGGSADNIDPQAFWENFCTNDYGDPVTLDNMDVYSAEYILLGLDVWNRLSDETKTAIDALLKSHGQPAFEKLVEKAKQLLEEAEKSDEDDALRDDLLPPTFVTDSEDGDDATLNIDPQLFWQNFCTNDSGEPITLENMDERSASYVLQGLEYWNQLSDELKATINALLQANGQPTFEELVLGAQHLLANAGAQTDMSTTWIIILCVAALVVIGVGIGVTVVIFKRKRTQKES